MNAATLAAELVPMLNAANIGELVYWTEADVYAAIHGAARQVCDAAGVLVTEPASISVNADQSTVSLPARTSAVLAAAWDDSDLRIVGPKYLESMANVWKGKKGDPRLLVVGYDTTQGARLFPTPAGPGTLRLIVSQASPDVSQGAPSFTAPAVIDTPIVLRALGRLRAQETEARMPDVEVFAESIAAAHMRVLEAMWR